MFQNRGGFKSVVPVHVDGRWYGGGADPIINSQIAAHFALLLQLLHSTPAIQSYKYSTSPNDF